MPGSAMDSLIDDLLEGDCAGSVARAARFRASGVSVERIVPDGVEAAGVESEVGRGATFYFTLPANGDQTAIGTGN